MKLILPKKINIIKQIGQYRQFNSSNSKLNNIIIDQIVKRTLSGRDYSGKQFKRYTKSYAIAKGNNKVNLKVSGNMLNSIKLLKDSNNQISIQYSGYGAYLQQDRQWLGMDKKQRLELLKYIKDTQVKYLKNGK